MAQLLQGEVDKSPLLSSSWACWELTQGLTDRHCRLQSDPLLGPGHMCYWLCAGRAESLIFCLKIGLSWNECSLRAWALFLGQRDYLVFSHSFGQHGSWTSPLPYPAVSVLRFRHGFSNIVWTILVTNNFILINSFIHFNNPKWLIILYSFFSILIGIELGWRKFMWLSSVVGWENQVLNSEKYNSSHSISADADLQAKLHMLLCSRSSLTREDTGTQITYYNVLL